MLLQALGAVLPAAVAVALSPFPLIGVVLTVAGPRGRINGPAFAVGWLVGLAVVTTVVALLASGADDPDSTTSAVADVARVVAGASFLVLGVRKWWRRPGPGTTVVEPTWMSSLTTASPGTALGLGALLGGANPKNFVLAAAAAASIAEAGIDAADRIVAITVFVVVGSCSVVAVVATSLLGGRRGASALEPVRTFMTANATVITVVVMLVLGAKILGDGLAGLGR